MKLIKQNRCVVFLVLALLLSGCGQKEKDPTKTPTSAQQANPLLDDTLRSLSPGDLTALGSRNELPTEWTLPNAQFGQYTAPKRFLKYGQAQVVVDFLKRSRASIPFVDQFGELDVLLMSTKIVPVTLIDIQSEQELGQQMPFPIQSVYVKKDKPVKQDEIRAKLLFSSTNAKAEKKNIASRDVWILPTPIAVPLDAQGHRARIKDFVTAICFPSEDSFVFTVGPRVEIEKFFNVRKGEERGVIAQRIGRIDLATTDFAFQFDYEHPFGMMTSSILPPPLNEQLPKSASSVLWLVNATAPSGDDVLRLTLEAKSTDDLKKANTDLAAALMELVQRTREEESHQTEGVEKPSFLKKVADVAKKIQIEQKESEKLLVAHLPNGEGVMDFFNCFFKEMNQSMDEMAKVQQIEQIRSKMIPLSRLMTSYYSQNSCYPPLSIRDGKGTPLLSWRVALLPSFGPQGEEIYKQFKLDEPWNGPNNIKLLEKMPILYQTSPNEKTKTSFRIFSSPETPFGKKPVGLSIKDIENPNRTILLVATAEGQSVEWTKPDELVFDCEKLKEMFGSFILGVPFMGDPLIIQMSDTEKDREKSRKNVTEWITGHREGTAPSETKKVQEITKPATSDKVIEIPKVEKKADK